ncbi:helix-turn-helix domain-containing protein [Chloroflexota bacterium]
MSSQGKTNRPQWNSERINTLRRYLGLTQRELADRLGTRQQTVSEWETGMYEPRGASATLLSIIAEQAEFKYQATPSQKPSRDVRNSSQS